MYINLRQALNHCIHGLIHHHVLLLPPPFRHALLPQHKVNVPGEFVGSEAEVLTSADKISQKSVP